MQPIVGVASREKAIEHMDPDSDLLVLQWHSEMLGMPAHEPPHALFRAFVETAAECQAGK